MLGKAKDKVPENYLPMGEIGYGLWEVWYDHGHGTPAKPIKWGPTAVVFLRYDEAKKYAQKIAQENPTKRYCVKLKNW